MYNKKYCNTLCCNSIRRAVEYILLTPSPIGQSLGGVRDLHKPKPKFWIGTPNQRITPALHALTFYCCMYNPGAGSCMLMWPCEWVLTTWRQQWVGSLQQQEAKAWGCRLPQKGASRFSLVQPWCSPSATIPHFSSVPLCFAL